MHVYLIPGMGLDEGLFFKLQLNATSINYLNWLEPESPNESLTHYCERMAARIQHKENLVLIGVSFGGMVAVEISKQIDIQQVIIISSIKTKEEKPWFFNFMGAVPVYKISTPNMRYAFRKRWGKYFGLSNEMAMDFFFEMFEKMSETYKDWAVKQISNWKNTYIPNNILHLHGDKDLIFPISLIKNVEVIKGGDHGMIVTRAGILSKRINEVLQNFNPASLL